MQFWNLCSTPIGLTRPRTFIFLRHNINNRSCGALSGEHHNKLDPSPGDPFDGANFAYPVELIFGAIIYRPLTGISAIADRS